MSIWEGGGGGGTNLEPRLVVLEDTEYVYEVWKSIGSGTTGTITPPAGSIILLDRYEGAADALVVELQGGIPSDKPVYTLSNAVVTTTFDTGGNYTFSGIPTSYPVGLVYQIKIKGSLAHFVPIGEIINKTDINPPAASRTAVYNIDFGTGKNTVELFVSDTLITANSVIIPSWVEQYDDLVIQGCTIQVKSIQGGVGYTLVAGAPNGAYGQYTAKAIIA